MFLFWSLKQYFTIQYNTLLAKDSYSSIVERTLNIRLMRTDMNLKVWPWESRPVSSVPTQRSGRRSSPSLLVSPGSCTHRPATLKLYTPPCNTQQATTTHFLYTCKVFFIPLLAWNFLMNASLFIWLSEKTKGIYFIFKIDKYILI